MSDRPTSGFVGTGVMGASMAGHLQAAGYPLIVHTRTRSRAEDLIAAGAAWRDRLADLAADADVVITIVGFPADVEACYFGPDGIIEHAPQGSLLIDMTTSSPQLAQRISQHASERGSEAIDAPVSGGDTGARNATLSIMVGGSDAAVERAMPVLRCMGKNIVHQGPPGAGQHTKLANQIAIASGMLGVSEALAYARSSGLDPERVLESIGGGAAGSWSLSNLGPRMLAGDFAPGFFVKHFRKDMRLASDSADELGLDTPGLDLARELYDRLAQIGGDDQGTQALYRLYTEDGG